MPGRRCRGAGRRCAVGALVGALSFRYGLRGSYFALVTLAFAEVFRILAVSFGFTGAGVGMMVPLQETVADLQPGSREASSGWPSAWCWPACWFRWLRHSRFGAWLQAVRDNEESAAALGVDPFRVKLVAIMVSGRLMAAAGAFYVQVFQYIDPDIAYGPAVSVEALVGPSSAAWARCGGRCSAPRCCISSPRRRAA